MAIMAVTVEATVTYTCYLDKEDAEKVEALVEENDDLSLEDAVNELYAMGELNLYKNSTESDFCTTEISQVEYQ